MCGDTSLDLHNPSCSVVCDVADRVSPRFAVAENDRTGFAVAEDDRAGLEESLTALLYFRSCNKGGIASIGTC